MDPTSKDDPFIEHTNLEIGNESSESDSGSESSSSSSSSSDSPDSGISPSSSDSDASGAPLRDATKKLFQRLYNSCKDSDLHTLKSIMPGSCSPSLLLMPLLSLFLLLMSFFSSHWV